VTAVPETAGPVTAGPVTAGPVTAGAGPVNPGTGNPGTGNPGTGNPGTAWTAGRDLPPLAAGPVSRTTLALFAGASGDGNPIHIDLDVARSAGLDDVFAHGMLSMAYLARLLTDAFGQQRLRSWKVRFAAITPVHARPVCTGRITAVDDRAGERLATVDLRVTLADGTETLAGEAVVALG
jgi:acyl dehydratase